MLWNTEADEYGTKHLVLVELRPGGHEAVYRCPISGRVWEQDFVDDDDGIPAVRLRWEQPGKSPAAIVERLASGVSQDEAFEYFHPEIEVKPYGHDEVLHGIEELRRFARETEAGPHPVKRQALSVTERGDEALVLGTVGLNRGGKYVENLPAAWLVSVRDGLIARVHSFDSWDAARRAAGFATDELPTRRFGRGLLWSVAGIGGPLTVALHAV